MHPVQEILLAVANSTKRWYSEYTQSSQGSADGINTSLYLNHSDLEVQNSYYKGAFKNISREDSWKFEHNQLIYNLLRLKEHKSAITHCLAHYVRNKFKTYTKITYN